MAPTISKIAPSHEHTLFMDIVGQVYGAGSNKYGQLDSNNDTNFSSPITISCFANAKHIAASLKASHIITNRNILKGCGDNTLYSVGHCKPTDRTAGTIHAKGAESKSIISAGEHAIEITSDGDIKFSGKNTCGQLGSQKKKDDIFKGLRKLDSKLMGKKFHCGSTGPYHTLLVTQDGILWTSGDNKYFQLGFKSVLKDTECFGFESVFFPVKIIKAAAGRFHSVVLDENGNVWTCGNNQYGQLGRLLSTESGSIFKMIESDAKFKDIAAGDFHTLLVDTKNKLWVAGSNIEGQLGLSNDKTEQLVFVVNEHIVQPVESVYAGGKTSFVISADKVLATGANECGQLGLGDLVSRNLFTELPPFTKDPTTSARREVKPIPAPPQLPTPAVAIPSVDSVPSDRHAVQNSGAIIDPLSSSSDLRRQEQINDHDQQSLRALQDGSNTRNVPSLNINEFDLSPIGSPLSVRDIRNLCTLAELEELAENCIILVHDAARGPNIYRAIKNLFMQHRIQMLCWCGVLQSINSKIAELSASRENFFEQKQEGLRRLRTFVEPIEEVEDEIKAEFKTKLPKLERVGVDDVLVFLNIAQLSELSDSFRKFKIDGSKLSLFAKGTLDYRACRDNSNTWTARNCCRLQHALELLNDGVFLSEKHENDCMGCNADLQQLLSRVPGLANNPQRICFGMKEFLGMKNARDLCKIFEIDMHKDEELLNLIVKERSKLLRLHKKYIRSHKRHYNRRENRK